MKRIYIISMLLSVTVSVFAQWVNYTSVHHPEILNQFTIMETGIGSTFSIPTTIKLLNRSYYKTAHEKNKTFLRGEYALYLPAESEAAEQVDSALSDRAKVEASNVSDRSFVTSYLSWSLEKDKILSRQRLFLSNIGKITLFGGTSSDRDYWMSIYEALDGGIKTLCDAYLPSSERHKGFLSMYEELYKNNENLCRQIARWASIRDAKKSSGLSTKPRRPNTSEIVRASLTSWKNNSGKGRP